MTFPTYEEWCEKVAEQAIDGYIINGRTIREWIEILSDELTMLDKIRAEISDFEEEVFNRPNTDYSDYAAVRHCLEIIDKYRGDANEMS